MKLLRTVLCLVFLIALCPFSHADTGEKALREALALEKQLRSKGSMFGRQDFSSAIDLYSRALSAGDLSPSSKARAHLNRADLYITQGNCAAAIPDLDEALKLRPNRVKAYAMRGSCHQQSKSYEEALGDIVRATALAPRDPALLRLRGAAHAALSEHDKAVLDYTASINLLRPRESSDLFVERGDAFKAQGKYERAIEDYQRAVQVAKKNAAKLSPANSDSEVRQLQPIFARLADTYQALAKTNRN